MYLLLCRTPNPWVVDFPHTVCTTSPPVACFTMLTFIVIHGFMAGEICWGLPPPPVVCITLFKIFGTLESSGRILPGHYFLPPCVGNKVSGVSCNRVLASRSGRWQTAGVIGCAALGMSGVFLTNNLRRNLFIWQPVVSQLHKPSLCMATVIKFFYMNNAYIFRKVIR